jgi:hypothetical protein
MKNKNTPFTLVFFFLQMYFGRFTMQLIWKKNYLSPVKLENDKWAM